ncbi:hypothetical protein LYNGBM3L_04620 [Moorena producens 3L]|uniref:Uncharacterized protein n=1 Tax=Moorena producens 3L TaxID=489825 RepID=F4XJ06_9CYAN|nr:hypothetical protein LYNGBM3L_04620 [Moorena producens 3L]
MSNVFQYTCGYLSDIDHVIQPQAKSYQKSALTTLDLGLLTETKLSLPIGLTQKPLLLK